MSIFKKNKQSVTVPVRVTVSAESEADCVQLRPATCDQPKAKELRVRTTWEAFPPPSDAPPPRAEPDPVNTVEVVMKTGKRKKFEASDVKVGSGGELRLRRIRVMHKRAWKDAAIWDRNSARLRRMSLSGVFAARAYERSTEFTDAEFDEYPVKWEAEDAWCDTVLRFEMWPETVFEEVIAPGEWKSYGVFHEPEDPAE